MTRFVIVPYKMGSNSCKNLKEKLIELGHKAIRVLPNSRTFKAKRNDIFIYYGKTSHYLNTNHISYNKHTENATDKLLTFQKLWEANLSTVPWTTSKEKATEWLNQNKTVVARSTLTGHSGIGITIHSNINDTLPDVHLYTQYIKKTYECRVHVFKGTVIDAQIKRKVRDVEEANTYIRNHHTGWVYCREDFVLDTRAAELSIQAVNNLGLDFGAVDLIYNQHYNQFYILEVNTAPGLEGTTLINYANAFIQNGDLN